MPSATSSESVPTTAPSATATTWWSSGSSAAGPPRLPVGRRVDLGAQQPPVDVGVVAPGEHRVEVGLGRRAQLEALGAPRPELGSGHAPCLPVRGLAAPPGSGEPAGLRHRAHWPAMSTDARSRDPTSRAFVAGLPKAELHVHHVGSASPRIVAELAGRHPDSPVPHGPRGAGPLLHASPTSPTSSTCTSRRSACCAPPTTCGCSPTRSPRTSPPSRCATPSSP